VTDRFGFFSFFLAYFFKDRHPPRSFLVYRGNRIFGSNRCGHFSLLFLVSAVTLASLSIVPPPLPLLVCRRTLVRPSSLCEFPLMDGLIPAFKFRWADKPSVPSHAQDQPCPAGLILCRPVGTNFSLTGSLVLELGTFHEFSFLTDKDPSS